MRKTFPLPQLLAGSKRATSAAVSDCAAHSRQLRSSALLPLLPLETPAPPRCCTAPRSPLGLSQWCRWAGGFATGELGTEISSSRILRKQHKRGRMGAPRKDLPKMSPREAWCCAVCVANTLINHNNGLPGKNSSPSHLTRPTVSACSFKAVRLHVSCTHLLGRIATRRLQ